MDIQLKIPVWMCKELQRDSKGTESYQTTIKRILKEYYKGIDRREIDNNT